MAGKKLAANVNVGGVWYGPAYGNESDVPADVAKTLNNDGLWAEAEKAPAKSDK